MGAWGRQAHAGSREERRQRKENAERTFSRQTPALSAPVRVSPESSGLVNLISCQNSHDNESRPAGWHQGSATVAGEIARFIHEQEIVRCWHREAPGPPSPPRSPGATRPGPLCQHHPGPWLSRGDAGTAPEDKLMPAQSLPTRADAVPSAVLIQKRPRRTPKRRSRGTAEPGPARRPAGTSRSPPGSRAWAGFRRRGPGKQSRPSVRSMETRKFPGNLFKARHLCKQLSGPYIMVH